MRKEAAFLAEIQVSPADNTPRLIYADWLEERGDPRSEFLRIECALVARRVGEPVDAPHAARYLALWLSADPNWLQAVDRFAAGLFPSTCNWEIYNRAESYSRAGWKANMLCHLLMGLYGTPPAAHLLPAVDLQVALAEQRVLKFTTSRDGYGGGNVWVWWATPEDNCPDGNEEPRRYHDLLVFPCIITDEIRACLASNWWERVSESPFWTMPIPRQELVDILRQLRVLLARPDNDFAWSSWEDASAALAELDRQIAAIEGGQLPPRLDLAALFAPTGPVQEVSLSSGWGDEFLALAARFDAVAGRLWANAA